MAKKVVRVVSRSRLKNRRGKLSKSVGNKVTNLYAVLEQQSEKKNVTNKKDCSSDTSD